MELNILLLAEIILLLGAESVALDRYHNSNTDSEQSIAGLCASHVLHNAFFHGTFGVIAQCRHSVMFL